MKEELYSKIKLLQKEYLLAKTGRKQIQEEILKTIRELRSCTDKYDKELQDMAIYYQYRGYFVNDYRLVMNVLLRLANVSGNIYGMKEIMATDFATVSDSEVKQVYGRTLVIANNSVLENIDNDKFYYYDEFSNIASGIIKDGYSMIIVTPNFFDGNVKPKDNSFKNIKVDIKNGGLMGNISCYLQDEIIEKAVYQVIDYIDINGADFQNIDEDTLYNLILENSKQKELKK